MDTGRYADAAAVLTRVVRDGLRSAAVLYDLARARYFLGEVGPAVRLLRRARRVRAQLEVLGFLASVAAFDPAMTPAAVLECRRSLRDALRRRFPPGKARADPRPAPSRRLRVGYVSSFFHADNWMKPVWALLDHHDPAKVEVHVFSDSSGAADARRRTNAAGARFHDIFGRDNREAARRIAAERLDILVDLNGYSKMGRLPIFLSRPAPVVIAWFNNFGTTGLECFDALIGDDTVIRDGEERWYIERVIRLPMSHLTFEVTYPTPPVSPPPCLRNGFVTFGSLAPLYKLDEPVLRAWSEILKRCPKSCLLLANWLLEEPGNRSHLLARLGALGIGPDRLLLAGGTPYMSFLRRYNEVDIALDTFPYNGGTSTIEALWQGVPVLTFAGDRWIARNSASILCNAGLEEFVLPDLDAYIEDAVRWGKSTRTAQRLRVLRAGMRARLRRSSVCDAPRLAREMEGIYRRLMEMSPVATPARGATASSAGQR